MSLLPSVLTPPPAAQPTIVPSALPPPSTAGGAAALGPHQQQALLALVGSDTVESVDGLPLPSAFFRGASTDFSRGVPPVVVVAVSICSVLTNLLTFAWNVRCCVRNVAHLRPSWLMLSAVLPWCSLPLPHCLRAVLLLFCLAGVHVSGCEAAGGGGAHVRRVDHSRSLLLRLRRAEEEEEERGDAPDISWQTAGAEEGARGGIIRCRRRTCRGQAAGRWQRLLLM